MEFPVRINKYLAHEGIATRRGADELITNNKVFVNGKPAVIGQKIQANDTVEVSQMQKKEHTYLVYYKPKGVISHSPAEGEKDVRMSLKEQYDIEHVFPVGRLDKSSEGLLFLTDDGRVTERLLSPQNAHEKEYEVTVDKRVTNHFINLLKKGVKIERYTTKPAHAEALKRDDHTFSITLTEGKKHQIRRMCAALGYQVQGLKRIRVMNLRLGQLKPGQYRKLAKPEQKIFLKEIGLV